jgi:hypothetical protein
MKSGSHVGYGFKWVNTAALGAYALLALTTPTPAVPPPTGVALLNAPAGGFAIDGDLLARMPVGASGDWVAAPALSGTGEGVLSPAGVPLNSLATFHFIDPYDSSGSDIIFTGGSKWADNPNTWVWTTGKPSSKTDINNVLLHLATDELGHTWAVISADRASTSGDSYIDFELLQRPLVRTNNGNFFSSGPHAGRTTNDLVLSLAFTEGGKVADFFAWRWQADGVGGFRYVDVTAALPSGRVFVALNTNTIPVPYTAFGGNQYQANAFAEAAIDLTALLGGFDPCESFGFEALTVKTKASASYSAGIEDLIEPIAYKLRIGPAADAGPDQTRCAEPGVTVFPLQGSASAGLTSVASTRWSVVAGSAIIDNPDALVTTAQVASQQATIRLEVLQANGCTDIDDVVLSAVEPPALAIGGAMVLCPDTTALFSAPPGMRSYQWSVSGNGTLVGATNQQTVLVLSSNLCDEPFELTLVASSNVCTVAAQAEVQVQDTVPPVLTLPGDLLLECPADTRTNVTGAATAQDDCGSVTVSYTDAQTNLCGGSRIIAREWTAMDSCGNVATATQTITVRDTTRPTLSIPPSITLECPANTAPTATGVATAQDNCGTPAVSFSDAVTAGCGGSKTIARTWSATDECGNIATAVQTITVQDTTRPTLSIPPSVTLECPADTRTSATGVATAQDNCGSPTMSFADAVTTGCGGSKTITRTWSATDECGNVATATQTITVRDTTRPTLSIPPSVTLECPANTVPNATGVATAQDNCGTPAVSFSDAVTAGCGGSKTITRTWSAIDECGNVATAVQTITVRDTTRPTLSIPPSVTLECPATTAPVATGIASAQDNCGTPTVSFADAVTTGCGGSKTIARTWSATDECGNVATAVQTIIVRDTTRPTLSIPPSVTLELPAHTAPIATGIASAQDNCGTPAVSFSDAVTTGCGGSKTIARTWSATDECGNVATAIQTITVRDTTAPTLTPPANITLECPADTRTNVTGRATATDASGWILIYSDVMSAGACAGTMSIARTWTATDACGNTTSRVQTILVQDTIPPKISAPNLTVQCADDVPSAHATLAAFLAAGGKASDTCDATLAFALASDSGLVGSCPGTVTRVYRAADDCGNVAECIQVITVDDTQAPLITCPGSVTVECGDSIEPTALGTATATDNCDPNVSVDYTDVPVPSQYLIKWYAADPDLNTGPYAPTYVKLAPASLPCPESASLTGRALAPLRNAVAYSAPGGQLDALTSLGGEPMALGQLVPFEAVIEVSGGPGPERGTLEFTSSWSTHTTSNDRFGYDTNYMVYCAFVDFSDPGTLDPNANARVESFHSTLLNPGSIDEKILGKFRISGLESGDRVVVEIWVVLSSQRPSQVGGTIASDLVSAEKATVPPQPISTGAQTVSIGNLSKLKPLPAPQPQGPEPVLPPQPPALPGATVSVIDRTWRATDDCGNRNTCVQRITVRDTTPPQFVEAQALQVIEPGALWTPEPPEAVDGCGEVTVRIYTMETNLTASGSHVVNTTWEAIDESGNRTLMNSQVEIQPLILLNPELKFGVLNGRLVLSWSAQPAGWWLESAANLAQPRWKPVAIAPTLSSDRYVVELDPAGTQQSYRLATGAPPLALSPATPGKVALTWPALAGPHTIQRCTELASGLWTNQPASVVSTNGLNRVELDALGSRGFFRLVKPTP